MTGIAVIGAGAFGTALAVTLARDGTPVHLVPRRSDHLARMRSERQNTDHLPGVAFPDALRVEAESDGLEAPILLLCVPMQALSPLLGHLGERLSGKSLIACCKGVDVLSGTGPTAVIEANVPTANGAVLTGPSFAIDIAKGLPTALTLACRDSKIGARLQRQLSREALRLYISDDVIGAELGGALKNVIALAAGIAIGAGLGESARASVVTRGFAEMRRIAAALGANPETLSGLSGLGDLVLTCTSEKSRNFSAGLRLGQGAQMPEGTTLEGVATARAVAQIAQDKQIEAPLTQMVAAVLAGELTVEAARAHLLSRPLKSE